MLEKLKTAAVSAGHYAKAIVAVVTPFVIQLVIDVAPALQGSNDRVIAALGTAVAVFVIPNLPKRTVPVEG